jgi:hypothetical protein
VCGPPKKALKGHRFRLDEDFEAAVVKWFQLQHREFFAEWSISWCVNGMPASMPIGTTLNGLHSFSQNNPQTGFIRTNLIYTHSFITW